MILEEDPRQCFYKWHAPITRRNTGIYGIHRRKLDTLILSYDRPRGHAITLRKELGIADRKEEWWLWAKEY